MAGFLWLLTFAHRFRCASAIARRALALRIRRGLVLAAEVLADLLVGLAWLLWVRIARAWRSRKISSSMAFNIWSFKGDPFVLEGAQNDDAPSQG